MSTPNAYTEIMDDTLLTPEQLQAWRTFRKMGEQVSAAVARDLTDATLTVAELGVLMRLEEAKQGKVKQSQVQQRQTRQGDLAEVMDWHKSRLSHLLSRMEERGLVERQRTDSKGVTVVITERGQSLKRQQQPIYERAVQRHFIQKLSPEQLETILELAKQLGSEAFENLVPS